MRDTLTCDLSSVVILGLNSLKFEVFKVQIHNFFVVDIVTGLTKSSLVLLAGCLMILHFVAEGCRKNHICILSPKGQRLLKIVHSYFKNLCHTFSKVISLLYQHLSNRKVEQ